MASNQFANNASTQSQAGAERVDIAMPSFGTEIAARAEESDKDRIMQGLNMIGTNLNAYATRKQSGETAKMNEAGLQSRGNAKLAMEQAKLDQKTASERAKFLADAEEKKRTEGISSGASSLTAALNSTIAVDGHTQNTIAVVEQAIKNNPEEAAYLQKNDPKAFAKLTDFEEMHYNAYKEFTDRKSAYEQSGTPMSEEQMNLLRAEYPDFQPGNVLKYGERYKSEKQKIYKEGLDIAATEQKQADSSHLAQARIEKINSDIIKAQNENKEALNVFGVDFANTDSAQGNRYATENFQKNFRINPKLQYNIAKTYGISANGTELAGLLSAGNAAFNKVASDDVEKLNGVNMQVNNLIAVSGTNKAMAARQILVDAGTDEKLINSSKINELVRKIDNPDSIIKGKDYASLSNQDLMIYSYAVQIKNSSSAAANLSLTYNSPLTAINARTKFNNNQQLITGGTPLGKPQQLRSNAVPEQYSSVVKDLNKKYSIQPDVADMLNRQISAESNWNSKAGSSAGAKGIAQFMPDTAKGMGVNVDDTTSSLDGQRRLMLGHLKTYGGDKAKSLAAYNWGGTALNKAINKYGNNWLAHAPKETRDYIQRILGQ